MSSAGPQNSSSDSATGVLFAVDFAPFRAFTDYILDPSPVSNPTRLVRTNALPLTPSKNITQPLFVHPAWALAGWSATQEGDIYNRPTTNSLPWVLENLLANPDAGLDLYSDDRTLDWVALLPIMHTLSLIDSVYDMPSPSAPLHVKDAYADTVHPTSYQTARMFIWAYSLDSRTSNFGAAVVLLGCVVVLAQAVLGFVDRRRYRSPTQLLVAALEHAPRGEFEGRQGREIGNARFRVEDDEVKMGKFSFYEPVA